MWWPVLLHVRHWRLQLQVPAYLCKFALGNSQLWASNLCLLSHMWHHTKSCGSLQAFNKAAWPSTWHLPHCTSNGLLTHCSIWTYFPKRACLFSRRPFVRSVAEPKEQWVKGLLIPFSKWTLWVHLDSFYMLLYRDNWVVAWYHSSTRCGKVACL